MNIYTKTGDSGTTGLIGGRRVPKDDVVIEMVGALDELNAAIGSVRTLTEDWPLEFLLEKSQRLVFEIGSEVASCSEGVEPRVAELRNIVENLERSIDLQTRMLPELKNFVLPGGCELAARLHWARCMARRAERQFVRFSREFKARNELLVFLNRLSDWLFVAARTANQDAGLDEPIWTKED